MSLGLFVSKLLLVVFIIFLITLAAVVISMILLVGWVLISSFYKSARRVCNMSINNGGNKNEYV